MIEQLDNNRLIRPRAEYVGEMDLQEQDETTGDSADQWTSDWGAEETATRKKSSAATTKAPIRSAAGLPKLMTGADLLNAANGDSDSEPPAEIAPGFQIGKTVRHPRYGLGTIIKAGEYSRRPSVTVLFRDDDRTATYVLEKCPLQPVGLPGS